MILRPFPPAFAAALLWSAAALAPASARSPAATDAAQQMEPSIVYRSDVSDTTAKGLASQPQFSGVGILSVPSATGTGAIIAPNWVLTAKHVVTVDGSVPTPSPTSAKFSYAGGNMTSDAIYLDPQSDMALVHFATALPATLAAIPPNLNGATKVQPVLAQVWNVGYGNYGNYGGTVNSLDGARRGGTNIVDSYTSPYLIFSNNNTSGTEFECSTGPGDSGGPMFLQNGYQWRIAAIVYGADSRGFIDTDVTHENFISTTTGIAFAPAAAPAALKWNSTYLNPSPNAAKVVTTLTDGGGNWNTTRLNFTDGGYTYAWENGVITGQKLLPVTFGVGSGAAGTVTLTTPINVSNVTFASPGSGSYTIAGSATNTLTLAAAGSAITVNMNVYPTISAPLAGTGALTKLGAGPLTLSGASTYTGGTNISAGGVLLLAQGALGTSGDITVASGAALNVSQIPAGSYTLAAGRTLTNSGTILGSLVVGGTLTGIGALSGALTINAGGLLSETGGTLTLNGPVTNNGTIRLTGGAILDAGNVPSFVNNGVLDLISGSVNLPFNFQNGSNGTVLTKDSVRVKTTARTATSFTLTVDSYSGHAYQLQRGTSPDGSSFANVGAVQNGSTGTTLTFTDASPAADRGFYRVVLTP